ncbi:hypothetical protein CYY_004805 [Polysphondylium violaceum]|uniref:Regulator of chromosome condensation domain-containing protein n=1 Tax=Polysphondylium violaceum TaxID=133409 RepID=A0A8J4PUT3_9MYCE|nr:hypothetical protein CYY_004805 [Polysphondylium violaceum]
MLSSVTNWLGCGGASVEKWFFGEGEDESESSSSAESFPSEEDDYVNPDNDDDDDDDDTQDEDDEDKKKKKKKNEKSRGVVVENDVSGCLVAWGYNYFGQCGSGTNKTVQVPLQVHFDTNQRIRLVSSGDSHSMALTEDGRVFVWGCNRWGQLGLGDQVNRITPTLLSHTSSSSAGYSFIATGSQHSMLISSFGEIYSFGCGTNGRLGLGDEAPRFSPTLVASLMGKRIVGAAAGIMHSACIDSQGRLYTWGWNRYGQLGNGSTKVSCAPVHHKDLYKQHFTKVVCGKNHTIALNSDGEMVAFGYNICGQLGIGNLKNSLVPSKVDLGEKVIDVAAGYYHSLCVTDNGEAYSWGYMSEGSLGLGEVTRHQIRPQLIPLSHVRHSHNNADDVFNEIYAPDTTNDEELSAHKAHIEAKYSVGDTVDKVFAGAWNSAIITSSGKLYCFGAGDTYRIGNELKEDQDIPVVIQSDKWGLERLFNIDTDTDIDLQYLIQEQHRKSLKKLKKQTDSSNSDSNSNSSSGDINLNKLSLDNDNCNNSSNNSNNDNSNNSIQNIDNQLIQSRLKKNLKNVKVYSRVVNVSIGGAHSIAIVENKPVKKKFT